MRVVAVVVTYNRVELLKETLDAILSNNTLVSEIIVINNASQDGTKQYLQNYKSEQLFPVHMACNLGGAGGFKYGIKLAEERGAQWIWCMDDDCIPHSSALTAMLDSIPSLGRFGEIGYLASRVEWVDQTLCFMNIPVAHWLWSDTHREVPNASRIIGSSFVSILLNTNAVRTVGLPVSEFFIWFDDAEYSRRISSKYPCYLISNSVVVHKTPKNFLPLDYAQLNDDSLWKYKYGIRNEMSFHVYNGSYMNALVFVFKNARRLLKEKKHKYILSVLGAIISGLCFNYKKYIEYSG
ncbi:glycosyltransferase family 2 protein [Teredinibacter waterburyi]|uniref:glycosyltransferase family 2 protein n=1 Tax=Teredinibacter waterburyi TaxID=1500538 RepID=UPI00165FA0C3|nr:glycosyltransferase family 2 protein [Teredinibacter waterburyi]